jgi:LacI family transcriptional regulator
MAKSQQPTIYDVAKQAEVSAATVSRVLNRPSTVREETRCRVLAAIELLQFEPHREARERARRQFRRIGVLVPFFTAPSFVQRMRGITLSLPASAYELIVYTVQSSAQLDEYLTVLPMAQRIDGLIMLSLRIDDEAARRIRDRGLPTVCVEGTNPLFTSVEVDNTEGGRLAAKYLLDQGCRRIAFVGESDEPAHALRPTQDRLVGFREVLDAAGVPLPKEYVHLNPAHMDTLHGVLERLLTLPSPPEAVFASSDLQAFGLLKAARKLDVSVPGDLSILGFDNIDMAQYLELTTVDQSLEESGRIAVESLIARITDDSRPLQSVRLRLQVVERATV